MKATPATTLPGRCAQCGAEGVTVFSCGWDEAGRSVEQIFCTLACAHAAGAFPWLEENSETEGDHGKGTSQTRHIQGKTGRAFDRGKAKDSRQQEL